jgi:GTP1/Obg family GTP-binding protein
MSLKDSLQKKLETQAEYWNKQIKSLQADAEERMAKAKDDQAEARIQKEFSERIQDLEKRVEEARNKISEVRDAGEAHLNKFKDRIDDWLSKRD